MKRHKIKKQFRIKRRFYYANTPEYDKTFLKLFALRTASLIFALLLVVSIYSHRDFFAPPLNFFTARAAKSAVLSVFPDGVSSIQSLPTTQKIKSHEVKTTVALQQKTVESKKSEPKTEKKESAKSVSANTGGKIKTETIGYSGSNLAIENLHIANNAGLDINLKKQLSITPDIEIYKNSGDKKPQVLILHTHATECYYPKASATYSDSTAVKSRDNSKNVVSVGEVIANVLEQSGISTLHDKTQYDRDAYSGSYERARKKTAEYLKQYPSIDVVLDIHRDSITYDSGTKLCPVAEINGKNAAQIMICCGSESGSVEDYPNWLWNFRFAARLQNSCEKRYKNLARPMYFVSKKYNHDLCNGSVLIEVGSEANTLEQAKYSGQLIANALIDVFAPLSVN